MKRKRTSTRPKTANQVLSSTVTDSFISDLGQILSEDDSPKASVLKELWLSKYVVLDSSSASDRRSKAIAKWLDTEQRNQRTNHRLVEKLDEEFIPLMSYRKLLGKVRSVVSRILPWTPSLDLLHGGFSGGSSTSKPRVQGHPALKFLDKADTTRPAWQVFSRLIGGTRWADHIGATWVEPRFVDGSVMFTVPKNAQIDRVAAKEPDLNMFFQKMLGNQIRTLLKREGIDLNDQRVNAGLARRGSIDGSLMTIDLSSASDSVTIELVRACLPFDWFYYLDLFRSPVVTIDSEVHRMNMFSSMGNGFTFELESLLFYSITRAVQWATGVRGTISVYGDDIIAPTEMQNELFRALRFFGFEVNEAKSFVDGPFRESCGAYWYAGIDVKPFYLRRPFSSISDLILTLNQLTQWASLEGIVDPRYEGILLKYRQYIPADLWGGQDLASRYSLVTGHSPRKELKPVIKVRDHSHVGGLLFWLFAASNRLVEGSLVVQGSSETGLYRLRRNRQWSIDRPIFLSEYVSDS